MGKKYLLDHTNKFIVDINACEFEDNTITFPAVVNGHKIKGIEISPGALVDLGVIFKSFDVVIEDGIEEIEEKMFAESKIRSITIPPSIKTIPESCFIDSTLKEVIFQENSSLKTISKLAFAYCQNLTAISIPSSVESIHERAFRDSELVEVTFQDGGKGVNIGELAFAECNSLLKVTLPDSKVTFDKHVFFSCEALETVEMSNSVIETISECLFVNCTSLKNAILPGTVRVIEERAFCGCTSLKTVGLANTSVHKISNKAFKDASSYCDCEFPDTLECIGKEAFFRCNLNSFKPPLFGLNEIGDCSFAENPIAGKIDLRLLMGCDTIGDKVFAETNIESITLMPLWGENVSAKNMFDSCKYLKEVSMADNAGLYAGMFNNCTNLEIVNLSDTLSNIPRNAFRKTNNLKNIIFPDSLHAIEHGAFYYSGIESLDLSKINQVSIEPFAFRCTALKVIELPLYGCDIDTNAFEESELDIIKEKYAFVNLIE